MIYYTSYIKDVIGNNYLGIKISSDMVAPFLEEMKTIIGDEYDEYKKYQQDRDSGYHITVINVMSYNKLSKELGVDKFVNSLDNVLKYPIDDIQLLGIGTGERSGNKAFFIVVRSEKLKAIRDKYGLTEQDFHITIGFKYKDVFGIRKNIVLSRVDPFLKLFKEEYYKNNESFEFVKKLDNFDGNENDEIYPIKINDTSAIFKLGKNNYYQVSLIGDKLMISARWNDDSDKPIMSNTLIYRKIKNK